MKTEVIKEHLVEVLNKRSEVLFAYIHGSSLYSNKPRDIDIAVFLYPERYKEIDRTGEMSIGFAIPMEMELEKLLGAKVEVQVLNRAPLSFRYRVITRGELIIDKDSNVRSDFESLSRVEYFDFRPRREEYLREAIT